MERIGGPNGFRRTSTSIAEVVKAPRSAVSLWLKPYEADGVEGLLEGPRSGRPPALTPWHLTPLTDLLASGPVAYGFLSGVWTSPLIPRGIPEEVSVEDHPGPVRKILVKQKGRLGRASRALAEEEDAGDDESGPEELGEGEGLVEEEDGQEGRHQGIASGDEDDLRGLAQLHGVEIGREAEGPAEEARKAFPRTTFAVFRPTPGRVVSSSIVSGTFPPKV